MKELFNKIEHNIKFDEYKKEAKRLTKEDLEDIYCEAKLEYTIETGMKPLYFLGIMIPLFIFAGIILIMFSAYDNTETTNYNAFSKEICFKEDLGKLRYYTIGQNRINIECEEGKYTIPINE